MNSMIQTVDLTKKFNDFVANDHINLDVKEQEIKCIVGENGAGKSTMMNMLYGLLQPTSGKILIRGKEVTLNSPVDAIANGIGMVHQHFKLVPSLTVYENILLGAEITQKKGGMKTPFIDQKEEIKRVEKLIQENHLELNATEARIATFRPASSPSISAVGSASAYPSSVARARASLNSIPSWVILVRIKFVVPLTIPMTSAI